MNKTLIFDIWGRVYKNWGHTGSLSERLASSVYTGQSPSQFVIMTLYMLPRCRYQVAVVALDGGNPPKSGSILVDISVADVNDNAPVFDNDTYEV